MLARIRSFPLPARCLHHDHDYHQLVIALSGSAEFEIAGYGGRVDAMHGCLVPSGEVHFYEGLGDNHWRRWLVLASIIAASFPAVPALWPFLTKSAEFSIQAVAWVEMDSASMFLLVFRLRSASSKLDSTTLASSNI